MIWTITLHLIKWCASLCMQGLEQNALGNVPVLSLSGGIFCGATLDWVWFIGKGWWSNHVNILIVVILSCGWNQEPNNSWIIFCAEDFTSSCIAFFRSLEMEGNKNNGNILSTVYLMSCAVIDVLVYQILYHFSCLVQISNKWKGRLETELIQRHIFIFLAKRRYICLLMRKLDAG
jgi:hypothetical protein